MVHIKFVRDCTFDDSVYRYGQVKAFHTLAANAIVKRGDALYVADIEEKARALAAAKKAAEVPVMPTFRDAAKVALEAAGARYDGRWSDARLADEIDIHGVKI